MRLRGYDEWLEEPFQAECDRQDGLPDPYDFDEMTSQDYKTQRLEMFRWEMRKGETLNG